MGTTRARPAAPPAGAAQEALPLAPWRYPWRRVALGVAALALVGLAAVGVGAVPIPPWTVAQLLAARLPLVAVEPAWPASWDTIVWQLRLPRVALAGVVGAALAASGATYQGLFRNPLADPYLIGVAAGAGLGAAIVLATPVPLTLGPMATLPLAAFAGALAAVTVAYALARRSDGLPLTTMVLAGVAIASLAGAATSLLLIRLSPDARPLLGWLLGGFGTTSWDHLGMALPYVALGATVVLLHARVLNVLQLDEEQAAQLGVPVERTKLVLVAAASLTTAAAVAVSGLIGFVGLIAPHAVRLLWGPDHRTLLPMAMLVGAGFLIVADVAARLLMAPAELPVGIVTALCGAPFFLYLLRRTTRL